MFSKLQKKNQILFFMKVIQKFELKIEYDVMIYSKWGDGLKSI